jgi:hypothetical protein
MYVNDYKHPATVGLALPGLIALSVAFGWLNALYSPPGWFLLPAIVLGLVVTFLLCAWDDRPVHAAKTQYATYLQSCSTGDLSVVVNDPNRPVITKALIRSYLDEQRPGWHTQLQVPISQLEHA